MRIIAGKLGGRNFASPHSHRTRPMSDKIRGALFNTLGDIIGLSVLDAFAGTGALGFEALSRGASKVIAIDSDKSAQKIISENIKSLGLEKRMRLVSATAGAWLTTSNDLFDIVLFDPPYDNYQPDLLESLVICAKPGGLVVLSLPPKADFRPPEFLELITEKNYGDATLIFYRRQFEVK